MRALALDDRRLISAFHDIDRPDCRGNLLLDVVSPNVVNEGEPVKLWISLARTGKISAL